jgi:HK97 gp10 family phage protein
MDDGITLELEGVQELNARLESLKNSVQREVRSDALRAGAEVVFNSIHSATPRKTGRTAAQLKVRIENKKAGSTATIFFDQSWPWTALFLEKGTQNYRNFFGEKIKASEARRRRKAIFSAGSSEQRLAPRPFMAKAFAAAAPAALAVMTARLRAGIEAAARK